MTLPRRASVTPLIAATVAVMLVSVAGQGLGAAQSSVGFSVFAAAAFMVALMRVGWQINRPWWQTRQAGDIGPGLKDAQPIMAERNAQLLALGYAWGALSLMCVYLLTTLHWQHGWQYGLGMGLIALLIHGFSRTISARWTPLLADRLATVSLVHGWAATAGLLWLFASGKMLSIKGDWAANIVFIFGGIMIVGVSALALRTSRFLAHR